MLATRQARRHISSMPDIPASLAAALAAPAAGGSTREVAHSEGPTYQNFRFVFNVRGDTLYLVLADRQGDVWMSEVTGT
jgi:hypothetical protein